MLRNEGKRRKRLLSFLLAVMLVLTGIPLEGMAVKAEERAAEGCKLLARYPLQQDANDISGNGKHGEAHGSVSYNDGLVLACGKVTTNSAAFYITLPGDMFVGEENLTISVCIKNASNKGNYGALFFGTAPQANNMPLNYWLFKSVFTNTNNADKPFNSEVGVAAGSTEAYKGLWMPNLIKPLT